MEVLGYNYNYKVRVLIGILEIDIWSLNNIISVERSWIKVL